MTIEESQQAAVDRVSAVATRQANLASGVATAQSRLLDAVTAEGERVLSDPVRVQQIVNAWQTAHLQPLVSRWAEDLSFVGLENGSYFRAVAADLDAKDYGSVAYEAKELLQNRFGFGKNGRMIKGGYFESFLSDTTTRQAVQNYAWKAKASGAGLDAFKRDVRGLIEGLPGGSGLVQRHFNTYAYDTYQQADAMLQDHYAEKLQLPGALYLGGEVRGTRPFCHDRQGKAWTREEIAGWKTLAFAGKPSPYNPFTDRGGYNCRHHFHYITGKMLARRRSDLVVDEGGVLRYKADGKPVDVGTPSSKVKASPPPAAKAQQATTAPVELDVASDAPAGLFKRQSVKYRDINHMAEELTAGGWEASWTQVDSLQGEVPEWFARHMGGADMKRLGLDSRKALEDAGATVEAMQVRVGKREVYLAIEGKFPGKGGVFQIHRTFESKKVRHELFKLPPQAQGKGVSKKLFSVFHQQYINAELDEILVHANLDVGGYTWGRYGFGIKNDWAVDDVLGWCQERSQNKTLLKNFPDLPEQYKQMARAVRAFYKNNDPEALFPMDTLASMPGAKQMLVGSDWNGVMNLKNPAQLAIWENYLTFAK